MQASAQTPELCLTSKLGKSAQLPAQLHSQQSASPVSMDATYDHGQNTDQAGGVPPHHRTITQVMMVASYGANIESNTT